MGKKIFEEECAKYGVTPSQVFKSKGYDDYLRKKGVSGEPSFYSNVAYGKLSVPIMLTQIMPEVKQTPERKGGLLRRIFKKASERTKNLVLIDGLDEVLVSFAKCCS